MNKLTLQESFTLLALDNKKGRFKGYVDMYEEFYLLSALLLSLAINEQLDYSKDKIRIIQITFHFKIINLEILS